MIQPSLQINDKPNSHHSVIIICSPKTNPFPLMMMTVGHTHTLFNTGDKSFFCFFFITAVKSIDEGSLQSKMKSSSTSASLWHDTQKEGSLLIFILLFITGHCHCHLPFPNKFARRFKVHVKLKSKVCKVKNGAFIKKTSEFTLPNTNICCNIYKDSFLFYIHTHDAKTMTWM